MAVANLSPILPQGRCLCELSHARLRELTNPVGENRMRVTLGRSPPYMQWANVTSSMLVWSSRVVKAGSHQAQELRGFSIDQGTPRSDKALAALPVKA